MALAMTSPTATAPQPEPVATLSLASCRKKFTAFETNKRSEMDEGQKARRYYHGKQWSDQEKEALKKRNQPPITDNRIARKVDFLVGIEQRMRRDPKAYGRTPQHDTQADTATAGVRYVCDVNRWENLASNAAHDGMVTGIGAAWVAIEMRRSQPEVVIKHIDADRFFYDSRSTKPDFSDARFMGVYLWMDIEEAEEAWPDKASELRNLMNLDGGLSALKAEQDRATQWGDFERSRVRVVEFWERRRDGWHFVKFCGDTLLEGGISPYLDEDGRPDCPYVAWSPYIDEKGDRYGLCRNMIPMQDEINHRRSKFLHLLNSQKVFIRRGSVPDIDDFRREVARPNGIIEHDGEWGKDTGFVDDSKQLQGHVELLSQSQSALENLGPNPGLIGKGGGVADQSGRAILAQRDSGMTELSPVFERLRDWKLRCYRKVWSRIRQAWTGERWIRVTDDSRSPQFMGVNQYEIDPMSGAIQVSNAVAELDVDIILEEGPDTITMGEELLQRLSEIAQAPPAMWSILIELSNVPNKERLLEMVQQAMAPPAPPQPDPAQQAAVQLDLEDKAAGVEQKKATVAKTYSDIQNNRANAAAKLIQAEMARSQPRQISEYARN